MKNKLLTSFLFLFFIPSFLFAQRPTTEVMNKYPPSVIIRVHEVVTKIKIDSAMQLQLADHFFGTDSLLASYITSRRSPADIIALKSDIEKHFRQVLGSALADEFDYRTAGATAAMEATAYTSLMKNKYECDSTTAQMLYTNYYRGKVLAHKTIQQYKGTNELAPKLNAVMLFMDSINENEIQFIKSSFYIKNKLAFLDSVKPMMSNEKANIKRIFFSLCRKNKESTYPDLCDIALRAVSHDTIYYAALYKEEIAKQVAITGARLTFKLAKAKKINADAYTSLLNVVCAKEHSLTTLNYTFPSLTKYKDSVVQVVIRQYDSLINIVLMKDGSFPTMSQFALAIKNRQKLHLNQQQQDSLYSHAITLNYLNDEYVTKFPFGKFDPSPYESTHLKKILTEEQYGLLLEAKNKTQATEWAQSDWEELKKRGMASGYDSVLVIMQIATYNTSRLTAKERYADNKILQNAYVSDLDAHMPAALRRLRSARSTDTISTATKPKEINNTLKW